MVSRQQENQGVGVLECREHRADRRGRSGVAPLRLEHDPAMRTGGRSQLFRTQEAVGGICDHDGRLEQRAGDAARHLLQHGFAAHQGKELLGESLSGQGPQPRPGAARHRIGTTFVIHPTSSRAKLSQQAPLKGKAQPRRRPMAEVHCVGLRHFVVMLKGVASGALLAP